MNLRELLEDATAPGEAPLSRVTADDVYHAGQRRRWLSLGARVGTGSVAGFVLVATLITVVAPARAPDPGDPDGSTWVVHAAGGWDRKHLWAFGEPYSGGGYRMAVSDDG